MNRFNCFVLFVGSLLAASGDAQLVDVGTCPKVTPKSNFDKNQFSGKWYEVEKYLALYDLTGKCVTETFGDEFFVLYKSEHRRTDMFTGFTTTDTNRMLFLSNPNTATFLAIFTIQNYPVPLQYHILDTDYSSYAVAYSCTEIFGLRLRLMFVYTRNKTPDQATLDKAHSTITSQGLTTDNLMRTDHNWCPAGY